MMSSAEKIEVMKKFVFVSALILISTAWTSASEKKPRPCKFGDRIEYGHLGKVIKIGDNLDAYVSYPNNTKSRGGVILIPGIWGWELSNVRAFIDLLSANNFTAIVPDAFAGKSAWNASLNWRYFPTWMQERMPNGEGVKNAIDSSIEYLKKAHSVEKIALLGFCWGGQGVHYAMSEREDIVAGVSCYGLMKDDDPDFGVLKKPTLFIFGKSDELFPPKKIRELRVALSNKSKGKFSIRSYDGMGHAFVHRKTSGPDSLETKQILAARKKIINWFNRHFKK